MSAHQQEPEDAPEHVSIYARLDQIERLLEVQGAELRRLRPALMATVFTVAVLGGLFGHAIHRFLWENP